MMTANYFMNKERLDELEYFLTSLTREEEKRLMEDNGFLERFVRLLLKHNRFEIVMNILKEADNVSDPVFLQLWDEAHYGWHQHLADRPLTSVQKFRIRLKYPPPPSICRDGVRPQKKLGGDARRVLRSWFVEHNDDPYPNLTQRGELSEQTGLSLKQVTMWFGNARRRLRRRKTVAKSRKRKHSLKGHGKDETESQNSSAECVTQKQNERKEVQKKVAELRSLCTPLTDSTNTTPTPDCHVLTLSVQTDGGESYMAQKTPQEFCSHGMETGHDGSNKQHQTTTQDDHTNSNNPINQTGMVKLYEKRESWLLYSENGLQVVEKRNENREAYIEGLGVCEVFPVHISTDGRLVVTDYNNNTVRSLTELMKGVSDGSVRGQTVSETGSGINPMSKQATSKQPVGFSITDKGRNITTVSQLKANEQTTIDSILHTTTNRRLQAKIRNKSQKIGEHSPLAYSPWTGVETDTGNILKSLAALCDRVEKDTISPTDVAICMKLYGDSNTNTELQQYDSIAKMEEFQTEEVADSKAEEDEYEEMEEDLDLAEVEVETTSDIDDQLISMLRNGLQNGNNSALSQEFAHLDHRHLNDIPSKQPQYQGYQIGQREATPTNTKEHLDSVHQSVYNLSLIGTCSPFQHYRPEQFCNKADYRDIGRIQIFDTSPTQQRISKEGDYSTVVGEAIQGLLNLSSSSQEMDSSPPMMWSPQTVQGIHNLPGQQTSSVYLQ